MKYPTTVKLKDAIRERRVRCSAAIIAAMLGVLFVAPSLPAQAPAPAVSDRGELLSRFSDSLNELTSRVSPSVVQIVVTGYRPIVDKSGDDTDDQIGYQKSLGSGVIVDPDGYIMTNAHVVKGAQRVLVMLTPSSGDGSPAEEDAAGGTETPPLQAKIVGVAPTMDLALLKVEAHGLHALPFADYSKLKKGELVLAFGNPEGLENSVTMGVVSAVARQADPDVSSVFIQTDAPINPGNSGGALVNTNGELVGINTLILSESGGSQGLGFAIPSSVVSYAYQQLRKNGHVQRGVIGAGIQDITPDLATGLNLARQRGVIVADVDPGGPADKAGLQIQDILLRVGGQPVESVPMTQLAISTQPPGSVLKFDVLRGTKQLSLDIPVKAAAPDVDELAEVSNPERHLVAKLGFFGLEINDTLANSIGDLRIPSGVLVVAMSADQTGADTDLAARDIIHALNGKPVTTLQGLRDALNAMQPGEPGVLQVEEDGKLEYMTFEMP